MISQEMKSNSRQASAFLKSIANERRLLILCQLAEGERNVSELEALIGIRQPSLSQHLARLRNDGLVATRRDSKCVYYRLSSHEVEQVIGLLYQLFCSTPGKKLEVPAFGAFEDTEAA